MTFDRGTWDLNFQVFLKLTIKQFFPTFDTKLLLWNQQFTNDRIKV